MIQGKSNAFHLTKGRLRVGSFLCSKKNKKTKNMTCLKSNGINLIVKSQREPFKNRNLTIFLKNKKNVTEKCKNRVFPLTVSQFDRLLKGKCGII